MLETHLNSLSLDDGFAPAQPQVTSTPLPIGSIAKDTNHPL